MVKTVILLLLLAFIAFVAIERNRLYIRDPLATVLRDGAKEEGAQVFINYRNDVLIENDNPPLYVELVQNGQPIGVPANIKCIHYVACLTDADHATLIAPNTGAKIESMDSKTVKFRNMDGRESVVTLR